MSTAPPQAPPEGRIVVDDLTKVFRGNVRAVDHLTFTVEPGSVTGFLGPNGAGKTTTLRMVLGLVSPTSGHATIGGRDYRRLDAPSRTVGAALEASSFHPARTARNHLRIMCSVAGLPDARADEVLDLVGLRDAAKRKVRGYSLGMRQRLGLAQALLGDPSVLVLDEPANGLDPDGIRWLRQLLRALADQGRTVLVSSHQLNEVQEIADRVVILNRGRLVRSGSIDELTAGTDRVVVRTPTPEPLCAALAKQQGAVDRQVSVDQHDASTIEVRGLSAAEVGHLAFTAGVELHGLTEQRSDLEDLFFELTAQGSDPQQAGVTPGLATARLATSRLATARLGTARTPSAGATSGGRRGMNRLIRAEFRKLRTTQVWFWLLLATMAVSGLLVIPQMLGNGPDGVHTSADVPDLFTSSSNAYIVVFVLGVLGVTTEFRYQTITPTVLQTPSRWAIVSAKMITYALLGVLYSIAALATTLAVSLPWLASRNIDVDFGNASVIHAIVGVFGVVALFGIVGLGIGALVRNQIVAVVVGLIWLLVLEQIVSVIPGVKYAYPYLTGGAVVSILHTNGSDTVNGVTIPPTIVGVIVLLLWAFIPAVVGAAYSMNRDIT